MTISVDNLSKRFGMNWVLKNVAFSAGPGTVTGIFGRKSSGKTTLVRIVAGLEKPNGGRITLDGKILPFGHSDTRVAFVPTFPVSTFWHRAFGGKLTNTVDIASQQSDAIDAALKSEARLIALDDALCFFDREEKLRKRDAIRAAVADGDRSVLYAGTDFGEIMEFCDSAVLIDGGEAVRSGTPREIYDDPQSTAAASMTGRTNIFEARRTSSSKAEAPEFQTIVGSHHLQTQKVGLAGLGAINRNVNLSIRPEHISISFGASFPADNLLKATITNVQFLGPLTLVGLDAGGLPLEAYVQRLVGLSVGDECMVGLPPDRIVVLTK